MRLMVSAVLGVFCLVFVGCGRPSSSGLHDSNDAGGAADIPDGTAPPVDEMPADGVPVALATGQYMPNCLTVDGTNAYWTTGDKVVKAPIAGGRVTVLASGQTIPRGIAVDATSVYWVTSTGVGQIMSVPIEGGVPAVLADGQRWPFKLAVRDGVLYWTNNGDGTVMRMAVEGGSPTQIAKRQGSVVAIVAGAQTLYWSSIGQGVIRSVPLDGGGDIATIATEQDASTLFVVGTTVYWANIEIEDEGASVYKLDGRGADPVEVAKSPGPLSAVADLRSVYWTDETTRTIRRVSIDGGEVDVLATDQVEPSEIAIDARNIYWINSAADGSIMKLAK